MLSKWIAGEPLERFLSLAGLGLNVLFVANSLALFVPPGFLNPAWELQTIGELIGLAPVLLLGLALAGAGASLRGKPERLRPLQVYAYVCTGLFALCIPLLITDSLRLFNQTRGDIAGRETQVLQELDRQAARLAQFERERTLPPGFDLPRARTRLSDTRARVRREAGEARTQALISQSRFSLSRLVCLLALTGVLLALARLCQLLARGITLDARLG